MNNLKNDYFNDNNKAIYCNHHSKLILLFCVSCSTPLCLDCIVSGDHLNHSNGNKIEYFSQYNIYPILEQFKNQTFNYLKGYNESNNMILQSSNKCMEMLKNNALSTKITINKEFRTIHNKLDLIKKDLIKQLIYNNNKFIINDNIKKIRNKLNNIYKPRSTRLSNEYDILMVNKLFKHDNQLLYYSNGEPTICKRVILDKHIDYSKLYLNYDIEELHIWERYDSNLNKINHLKKIIIHSHNNYFKLPPPYSLSNTEIYCCYQETNNHQFVYIKQHVIEKTIYFTINKNNLLLINKEALVNSGGNLAIGDMGDMGDYGIDTLINLILNLKEYILNICFLEDFNLDLNQFKLYQFLPNSHLVYYLYNILKPLQIDSISISPNNYHSISNLHLMNGFNHRIYKDVIPDCVKTLWLSNIGPNVLEIESIPNSIKNLHLYDGFNQKIIKGIIPDGIKNLYLGDIGPNILEIGIIPSSIKKLYLQDGFNQKIIKGIFPNSIEKLFIGHIGLNLLETGSLPNSIKELHLIDGFNQQFINYKEIIPNSLEKLFISNIGNNVFTLDSFPNYIKEIHITVFQFNNKYKLFLDSFDNEDIKYQFKNIGMDVSNFNSISDSIKELYFIYKWSRPIINNIIIPNNIKVFLNRI